MFIIIVSNLNQAIQCKLKKIYLKIPKIPEGNNFLVFNWSLIVYAFQISFSSNKSFGRVVNEECEKKNFVKKKKKPKYRINLDNP